MLYADFETVWTICLSDGCSMEQGELGAEGDRQSSRAVTSPAWYPNKKSRDGPMSITSVSHSPVFARQVCSDEAGPRPSQEVKLSSCGEERRGTTLGTGITVMKLRPAGPKSYNFFCKSHPRLQPHCISTGF